MEVRELSHGHTYQKTCREETCQKDQSAEGIEETEITPLFSLDIFIFSAYIL